MGTRGPVPARSDQRRRRNKPETPTDRVAIDGKVTIPAPAEGWHPIAAAWYGSLERSGQSRYFEPSDWQAAHFTAALMSDCLSGDGVNAQLVAQIRGMMADLLTTEGARRRAGIELERVLSGTPAAASTPGGNVTVMDDRRKRLSGAS
jgi:hypothetical protein